MEVDLYLLPSKKRNSKDIKDLNVRLKTLKSLEENVEEHSENNINSWPMGPHEIERFLHRKGKH